MLNKGHKVIDAEKLNDFLKKILPQAGSFDRNFIAYKIAEYEDDILKEIKKNET
jgi:hypothetical protein